MLHDPSHVTPIPVEEEIVLSQQDKDILRRLGEEIATYGSKKDNSEKAKLWTDLNDLNAKRPMVWINEIPWHEMNVDDELTNLCEHPWARELETKLRREIYQAKHMCADMVINNYIECPKVFHSTDFGILEDVETAHTDSENEIYSRHFIKQINEIEDIEKIKIPKITFMEKATEYRYQAMKDVFDSVIDVKQVGQTHIWYTPWDFLIRWWGIEDAMMDLVMQPEMVHEAYDRMVDAWMKELDQLEELNLLSLDCNNTRVGSGGYGYVSCLPGTDFDENNIKAKNMWGCSNAQIFSSVSPQMHWEFAIEHDLKWLRRFGLTYYGCCEPLDNKMEFLRRIPNLRKISVSAWCDTNKIVEEIGQDYVMSRKPNPAIFAGTDFDAKEARKQLVDFCESAKGCNIELIMKDVSTVNYDPKRLWKWSEIAMEVATDYANR